MAARKSKRVPTIAATFQFGGSGPNRARFTALGGGFAIPSPYWVTYDDPSRTYVVRLRVVAGEERPVCDRVEIERRPGAEPIRGDKIRLPIDSIIWTSLPQVVMRGERTSTPGSYRVSPVTGKRDLSDLFEQLRPSKPGIGRPAADKDQRLEQVAEIYRKGVATGAPVVAVAEALHISRSHAGRLVLEARRAGKLPRTKRGRVKA